MRAIVAAAFAIATFGVANTAHADGDSAGAGPASAPASAPGSDDSGAADAWGVASSAGLTYAESAGGDFGAMIEANADQTVSQNYQFLDPNVFEYTQMVAGGTVVTLSGVLLQRDGDTTSDPAELDEEASGVYSAGSAALVPSLYGESVIQASAAGRQLACASTCDLSGGSSGPVKTLASYSSESPSSSYSSPSSYYGGPTLPPALPGTPGAPYVPPLPPVLLPSLPPPDGGGGVDPPPTNPGDPGNGMGGSTGGVGPTAVPEPETWALMTLGFFAIGALRRRRPERASAL